jgi:hypothetical protein
MHIGVNTNSNINTKKNQTLFRLVIQNPLFPLILVIAEYFFMWYPDKVTIPSLALIMHGPYPSEAHDIIPFTGQVGTPGKMYGLCAGSFENYRRA